jgi:hypothetical protein
VTPQFIDCIVSLQLNEKRAITAAARGGGEKREKIC